MSAVINFKNHLSDLFAQALRQVAPEFADSSILIERPKQVSHGDYACNLAMQLAKPLRKPPREIANALIAALPKTDFIQKVEIAGAGFINVFIATQAKQSVVHGVLAAGQGYGHIHAGAAARWAWNLCRQIQPDHCTWDMVVERRWAIVCVVC